MPELLLMRHAEAAPQAAGGTDYERPLTARGVEAATLAARTLQRLYGAPDFVLHSPAARTTETARLVHRALVLRDVPLLADPRIYLATHALLLAVLRELPPTAHRVLLVGHNPAISELAQVLEPDAPPPHFAPADVRLVRRAIPRWSDLEHVP